MPTPPRASLHPRDVTVHNDKRIDNYYWLRDRNDPEVLKYLKQENAYTDAVMKSTDSLRSKLYKEMKGRIKETDLSVPVKKDQYYYYSRTEEGKQYPIYCRKYQTLDAPEEVLLDQNKLAEGKSYFAIGELQISPDQNKLAYNVDESGNENFTVYIKDLKTGQLLTDRITGAYYSLEWANDNHTLFYNTIDSAHRPYRAYRHELGTDQTNDAMVYEEKDDHYELEVTKSRNEKYIYIELQSEITMEVRQLDAENSTGEFQTVLPRKRGVEYFVAPHGDDLYILTNQDAKTFKLVKTPVDNPSEENWQTIIPYNPNVELESISEFADYLAITERVKGNETIRVIPLNGEKEYSVEFDEPAYGLGLEDNPEFSSDRFRFSFSSMKTPKQIIELDFKSHEQTVLKEKEVPGYHSEQYETKRMWLPARDGTKIPVSLIYRKGLKISSDTPLLLYGYGAYGIVIEPTFSSNVISLVDRGFIYAIAHIRGGGFLGKPWYEDGKWFHKKNTFTDFIDVAQGLIDRNMTNPDHLAIRGGSAGGLLIGAVVNMRPDLFHAAIAAVPFVDVINTMLDESIPLTVIEYDEWGNPNQKDYYDYMRSYSPYDNVKAQDYPNLLITAGLNDPRVGYWEPAKFTAKLRAMKTDQNTLLLKTKMGAGHLGASGRYDYLKDIAFQYAFVLKEMGIRE